MKRIFVLVAIAITIGLSIARSAAQEPKLDLRAYFPLAGGDTWTYQVKQFRADGQVAYRLRTQFVAGEARPEPGVTAGRLMDDRGRYSLVAADARGLRVYGENAGQGEVKIAPAYTWFDAEYKPGKVYSARHTPSEGEAVTGEAVFYGVESVHTPAGAFRDCLKLRFQTTKPSGATVTTTRYLARGVGLVREVQEVFSPAAEQSLRYETELLHGRIAGRRIGGESARTVQVAEYFPFHQGDSWTYDWKLTLANGQTRVTERKRWFEGTKFTNAGAAFKLMSSTGEEDYQFYVLDRGGLRIVESGEKGMRAQGVKFYYEPALLIARDDLVLGRTYRWSQAEADGKNLMQFSTTLDGFESVETPMGRYENCLRARVEWETAGSRVKNVYFYARGVGLVAYDYEVINRSDCTVMMTLAGRVKEAVINANAVRTADEAKKLWDKMAAELAAAEDNPTARGLFKEASLNRYVWDADLGFRGFTADLTVKVDGGAAIPLTVKCSPALDIEIEAADPAVRAIIHEEMSQFVTHRQPRKPFDAWYGPDKAKFKLGGETPEGREIFIEGDSMGSHYIIGDKHVKQLSRNIGRMDFTIFNQKHQAVEDGRYIATEYGVSYYRVGTKQEVGRDWFQDAYVKQGAYWVPKSRIHTSTIKGKPARIELEITRLEYLK
jgi:Protein of unknown function (DUF3386)